MSTHAPTPSVPDIDPAPYRLTEAQMLSLLNIRSSLRLLQELTATIDKGATVYQDDLSMHLSLLIDPLEAVLDNI